MDRVWIKTLHVPTQDQVESVYFTENSAYLILIYCTEPDKVFRLKGGEYWEIHSSIPAKAKDTLLPATIWNDDLYMMATCRTERNTKIATLFSLGIDGIWMEKAIFPAVLIYAVGTSVDGIHVVTQNYTDNSKSLAKVWSLGPDGGFKEKGIFRNEKDAYDERYLDDFSILDREVYKVELSKDCRHLVVIDHDNNVILCSQNGDGVWVEKVTIKDQRYTKILTFSDDSAHLSMYFYDEEGEKIFRIWNLKMNGEWVEDIILSPSDGFVNSIVFSNDGSNMLISYDNGNVKIWGKHKGCEEWLGKDCVTVSKDRVKKAIFSPDSRYVLTIGGDSLIKLFELQAAPPHLAHCGKRLIHTGGNYLKSLVGFKGTCCVIL